MELEERKKQILRTIVERYVETAEPIGSKAIAAELGFSSATIRNEMAELEAMGYLEQPHTSAGRIPTSQGYRIYVNELMARHKLSVEETEEINAALQTKMVQLDKVMADVGKITSQLTSYPSYAMASVVQPMTITRFDMIYVDEHTFITVAMLSNNTVKNRLMKLPGLIDSAAVTKLSTLFNARFTNITDEEMTSELVASMEKAVGDETGLVASVASFAMEAVSELKTRSAVVAGTSHILEHPEFHDVDKAQKLMQYLSDGSELSKLPVPEEGNMKIIIGAENLAEELKDSSVIVARYDAGGGVQGLIGVVGPTRMDYSKIAARLDYIAKGMSWLLTRSELPGAAPSKAMPEHIEGDHEEQTDP